MAGGYRRKEEKEMFRKFHGSLLLGESLAG